MMLSLYVHAQNERATRSRKLSNGNWSRPPTWTIRNRITERWRRGESRCSIIIGRWLHVKDSKFEGSIADENSFSTFICLFTVFLYCIYVLFH